MSSPKSFIINGLHRSGTTLLERVFDSQRDITCFSLMFQILNFISRTKGFGGKEAVMFEDFTSRQFSLSENTMADWRHFLATSLIDGVFQGLTISGQSNDGESVDEIYGYAFNDYMSIYHLIVDADNPSDIASIFKNIAAHLNKAAVGVRWTAHHRYAPVFLRSDNAYWIEIIRDPYERRMSEKISHGTYLGNFIRQTQDILNFVSDFKHPRFTFIRFEDLIGDTKTTLKNLSDFLDMEIEETELVNPIGEPFKPNSSLNVLKYKNAYSHDEGHGSRIGALAHDKWASKMTDYDRSLITKSINLRGLYEARPGTAGSGALAVVALAGMKFRRDLKNIVNGALAQLGYKITRTSVGRI